MDDEELRVELAKYHRESYGWALGCCSRNPAEAAEVLQNVYLKILDGRARFHGQSSFKTWLLALIRNTAADEWRRKLRHNLKLINYEQTSEQPILEDRPDETMDRSETQTLLRLALAALPPRQQEVVQLVFYHDLSLSEAAVVMRISLGSARTHYERGKAGLRQWMEKAKVFSESGPGKR